MTKFRLSVDGNQSFQLMNDILRLGFSFDEFLNCFYMTDKWYRHDDDMRQLSEKYSDCIFELYGVGENHSCENVNIWYKSFYKGNLVQNRKARLVYVDVAE